MPARTSPLQNTVSGRTPRNFRPVHNIPALTRILLLPPPPSANSTVPEFARGAPNSMLQIRNGLFCVKMQRGEKVAEFYAVFLKDSFFRNPPWDQRCKAWGVRRMRRGIAPSVKAEEKFKATKPQEKGKKLALFSLSAFFSSPPPTQFFNLQTGEKRRRRKRLMPRGTGRREGGRGKRAERRGKKEEEEGGIQQHLPKKFQKNKILKKLTKGYNKLGKKQHSLSGRIPTPKHNSHFFPRSTTWWGKEGEGFGRSVGRWVVGWARTDGWTKEEG